MGDEIAERLNNAKNAEAPLGYNKMSFVQATKQTARTPIDVSEGDTVGSEVLELIWSNATNHLEGSVLAHTSLDDLLDLEGTELYSDLVVDYRTDSIVKGIGA